MRFWRRTALNFKEPYWRVWTTHLTNDSARLPLLSNYIQKILYVLPSMFHDLRRTTRPAVALLTGCNFYETFLFFPSFFFLYMSSLTGTLIISSLQSKMNSLLPQEHQRFSFTAAIAMTGALPRPTAFGSLKFHVPAKYK